MMHIDHVHGKLAFMGGFVTGMFEAVHREDIVKTVILAGIGALTSYVVSKVCSWAWHKLTGK